MIGVNKERKCADTIGTVPVPRGLAISNVKILIYFSNKMYGSNFIKQHSETAPVRSYQNADCSEKNFFVSFSAHFRSTTNNSINLPNWNKVVKLPRLEQFLHCGLRKFRHSKSSVYRWYPQLVRGRFVYDTYGKIEATRSRHGWVYYTSAHCNRPTS